MKHQSAYDFAHELETPKLVAEIKRLVEFQNQYPYASSAWVRAGALLAPLIQELKKRVP